MTKKKQKKPILQGLLLCDFELLLENLLQSSSAFLNDERLYFPNRQELIKFYYLLQLLMATINSYKDHFTIIKINIFIHFKNFLFEKLSASKLLIGNTNEATIVDIDFINSVVCLDPAIAEEHLSLLGGILRNSISLNIPQHCSTQTIMLAVASVQPAAVATVAPTASHYQVKAVAVSGVFTDEAIHNIDATIKRLPNNIRIHAEDIGSDYSALRCADGKTYLVFKTKDPIHVHNNRKLRKAYVFTKSTTDGIWQPTGDVEVLDTMEYRITESLLSKALFAPKRAWDALYGTTPTAVIIKKPSRNTVVATTARAEKPPKAERIKVHTCMHYLDGIDLHTYLQSQNIDFVTRLQWYINILKAVDFLHAAGYLHLDIKLPNVMVVNGEVYLTDFGYAKTLAEGKLIKHHIGSPLYMPPESLKTRIPESDIYALGMLGIELLLGRETITLYERQLLNKAQLKINMTLPNYATFSLTKQNQIRDSAVLEVKAAGLSFLPSKTLQRQILERGNYSALQRKAIVPIIAILGSMLAYNPKQRGTLQKIYSNLESNFLPLCATKFPIEHNMAFAQTRRTIQSA